MMIRPWLNDFALGIMTLKNWLAKKDQKNDLFSI